MTMQLLLGNYFLITVDRCDFNFNKIPLKFELTTNHWVPLSNLVVCQMLCIYFNDSMKVLRYIYFQKNLETLVPVTSLLHLSNLIYGWI